MKIKKGKLLDKITIVYGSKVSIPIGSSYDACILNNNDFKEYYISNNNVQAHEAIICEANNIKQIETAKINLMNLYEEYYQSYGNKKNRNDYSSK